MTDSWELRSGDAITPHLDTIKVLGGGKQHEVVLATDDRRLTTVVVKLLRPDNRDDRGLAILREEAERLETVRHAAYPRLLELADAGERPHLVMEHVEGPRLSRLVKRFGPLSLEQLLPLAIDVAGALHYLHGLRMVHLDVKPGNLVVSDRVRVIDLGLARTFASAAGLSGRLGTISWMAPEQHRPAESEVGPAADVWGWGAVLLFAATGDWPIRRLRREGGDTWVLSEPDTDHITIPGTLPDELASCLSDALSWRPTDRPSPAALARRLEPLVDALPRRPVLGRLRPKFTTPRPSA
ncbi:MAG: serine/threonine-protein kinase [Nitriliruptorales bacterium]|nr:serine/threonine-protein kinase [Nitriliruptorales bacterium]